MNRIVLIGRLTKDPELRYTPQGVPVATFTLAVDRPGKNAQGEREADFINIVTWRQRAEFISQYGGKGRRTAVDGRLQIRNFVGQDGMKRWVTEVIADNVELLDSAREGGGAPMAPGVPDSSPPQDSPIDDFADPFSED